MKIYKQNEIDKLVDILRNDGIISVPTDTVYGICVQINSSKAYDKLAAIKNRPTTKSFPVMCANKEQIKSIALVDSKVEKLIDAFMPGPITLVLNKKPASFIKINNRGTMTTSEIAVRLAPTPALNELISKLEKPVFMTSANLNGKKECSSLTEIEESFPDLDGILEGKTFFNQASTIVDCTSNEIKIQRTGPISIEQIKKILN